MERKLRIIINSNALFSTSGYGTQAEILLRRIKEAGYKVAEIAFYGLEGGIIQLNDIVMYPKMASAWGDDALPWHAKDFRADISFTLQDIWTMDINQLKNTPRWIPIVPIDHFPPPLAVIERLKSAYRIVTYSKFGCKELQKQGMYSTYIPHVVDTNVFKPLDNKKELRKKFNIPEDIFLFGMVAANKDNPPRKSFQEVIDAFAIFLKDHPNSGIFFNVFLSQQGGFPIDTYWQFLGLPKDKLFYLQAYDQMFHVGRNELAQIYNTFDCLLQPSTNEGFGVPIIEAQSCGIPVITNDFTSMPELIIPNKTGFLTKVNYKRFTPMLGYIGLPDVSSIANCMVDVYKKDRKLMGIEARKYVLDNYDADKVFDKMWLPYLELLEKEVYPSTPQ